MRFFLVVPFILSCDSSSNPASQPDMADPCVAQCTMGQPVGTPMAMAFFDCMNTACQQYPADSAEQQQCISDAVDPSNPNAACRDVTDKCFTGMIGGCKELADHVEQ